MCRREGGSEMRGEGWLLSWAWATDREEEGKDGEKRHLYTRDRRTKGNEGSIGEREKRHENVLPCGGSVPGRGEEGQEGNGTRQRPCVLQPCKGRHKARGQSKEAAGMKSGT
jgi:hypothetical protein